MVISPVYFVVWMSGIGWATFTHNWNPVRSLYYIGPYCQVFCTGCILGGAPFIKETLSDFS